MCFSSRSHAVDSGNRRSDRCRCGPCVPLAQIVYFGSSEIPGSNSPHQYPINLPSNIDVPSSIYQEGPMKLSSNIDAPHQYFDGTPRVHFELCAWITVLKNETIGCHQQIN
jgi:hypothetical protein